MANMSVKVRPQQQMANKLSLPASLGRRAYGFSLIATRDTVKRTQRERRFCLVLWADSAARHGDSTSAAMVLFDRIHVHRNNADLTEIPNEMSLRDLG